VQGRIRSSTGELGSIVEVSPRGETARDPQVRVGANGTSVFTWIAVHDRGAVVQARACSLTGALGPIVEIADLGPGIAIPRDLGNAAGSRLAVDATANAVFDWTTTVEGVDATFARTWSAAGDLGPAAAVAEGATVRGVVLAADGNGLITWVTAGDTPRVWARAWSSSPTVAPGPMFLVSPGPDGGSDPQVAMNAPGDAVIAWSTDHERGSIDRQARVRSRTGSLGAVHHLRVGNVNNATAIAGDASAFFAGSDDLDPESPILVRALSRSDRLSPLRVLQRSNDHTVKVDIAADDRGKALLVWRRYTGGRSRVVARSLSGAGNLGRLAGISPARSDARRPRVAMTPDGHTVIAWVADSATNARRVALATSP
jgi:hypothetical protein